MVYILFISSGIWTNYFINRVKGWILSILVAKRFLHSFPFSSLKCLFLLRGDVIYGRTHNITFSSVLKATFRFYVFSLKWVRWWPLFLNLNLVENECNLWNKRGRKLLNGKFQISRSVRLYEWTNVWHNFFKWTSRNWRTLRLLPVNMILFKL